jgi:hypothetical protein
VFNETGEGLKAELPAADTHFGRNKQSLGVMYELY